jgi:hypothetical protein
LASIPINRRILSVDGSIDSSDLRQLETHFDVIVQSTRSHGYLSNIRQALPLVESDYFFWFEDDFEIGAPCDWNEIFAAFQNDPTLAQVRWPRNDYLLLEDKELGHVTPNIWRTSYNYAFNPHVARTDFSLEALSRISTGLYAGLHVELAFSREFRHAGCAAGVLDPAFARAVHQGALPGRSDSYYSDRHGIPSTENSGGRKLSRSTTCANRRAVPNFVSNRYAELAIKALFAMGATAASAFLAPVSRQARAFLRHVWSYWRPIHSSPVDLGPSRDDTGNALRRPT